MSIILNSTHTVNAMASAPVHHLPPSYFSAAGVYAYQNATEVLYVGMAKRDLVLRAFAATSTLAGIRAISSTVVLIPCKSAESAAQLKHNLLLQFKPSFNTRGVQREVHRNQVACKGCDKGALLVGGAPPPICADNGCKRRGSVMEERRAVKIEGPLVRVFCGACGFGVQMSSKISEGVLPECGNRNCVKFRGKMQKAREVSAR